ncbi:lipase 3-like isoform X2 [Diabrotica virgifera virgifera]|uniref:Lipase n=2 Tax=Diabrotica virgifera virgifera TaxID=50390 RepID=A0ABM5L3Q5_DIAVI|nr:lipase 3-like isoform X2 [Diabrotica virgifera virgifera]
MMKLFLILAIPFMVVTVKPWKMKMKEYPYADMNLEQKVAHDGYPLEQYQVITKDHYYLTIFRIPYGRNLTDSINRSPVLLVHGMGASIDMFLLLGPGKGLAYALADSGYDVWLLNARGLWKSQRHKFYNINKHRRYWKFSFHEIAIYDLATNIDFILEKTKQKPFLIGHSQGNTCIFVLLAMKPDYNDKIKMGVAYAPTIKIVVDNIAAKVFVYGEEMVEGLYALLGADELTIMPNIMSIFSTICKEQLYFLTLCYHVLQVIGSHQSQLIDKDLVPAIVSSVPRNAAMQFLHYMQIAKRGTFAQYDYGAKRNMQRYNSSTPPLYDLNKITACIAIFYGEKDDIITVKGSLETIDMLPNVCYIHKVEYPYFNHIDFIFAKNASELVYKPTVDIFRKYDAEHN